MDNKYILLIFFILIAAIGIYAYKENYSGDYGRFNELTNTFAPFTGKAEGYSGDYGRFNELTNTFAPFEGKPEGYAFIADQLNPNYNDAEQSATMYDLNS